MKQPLGFNAPAGVEVNIMPVIGEASALKADLSQLPEVLPVLTLRNAVIFPGTVFPVTVGRDKSIKLVSDLEDGTGWLAAVPQMDISVEDPVEEDLCRYGTICKLIKTLEMPDGTVTAILQGSALAELGTIVSYDPYITARMNILEEVVPAEAEERELRVLGDALKEKAALIVKSSSFAPKEAIGALKSIDNFHFLVNFIATTIEVRTSRSAPSCWASPISRSVAWPC